MDQLVFEMSARGDLSTRPEGAQLAPFPSSSRFRGFFSMIRTPGTEWLLVKLRSLRSICLCTRLFSLLLPTAKPGIFGPSPMAIAHFFRCPDARLGLWAGWSTTGTVLALFLGAVFASPGAWDGGIIFLDPANLTDALRVLVPGAITDLAMTFVISRWSSP